jgi:hypothetical protein
MGGRVILLTALLLAGCGRQEATKATAPASEAITPVPSVPAPEVSATPSAPEVVGHFAPRDECTALPGWKDFSGRLRAAVAGRDGPALAALADPAIVLDFGGGSGPDELKRRLAGKDGPELWGELDAILRLGCAQGMEGGDAVLPWFFGQDLGEADPYQVLLVNGAKVPLRAAPDPKAAVTALVSWQLVDATDERGGFRKVSLPGGKGQGYIASGALRSPLDYRLVAQQVKGEWRLMAFVAGD